MKLLALVERVDHVCCRYRIAAFRGFLEAAGHTLEIRALRQSPFARWRDYFSAIDSDVVILQRKLLSRCEVAVLRRKAKRLIFDFDDALWLRDSHSGKGFESPKRARRFAAILAAADAVVAGNRLLAEQAAKSIDPPRVAVIPTCIELARYPRSIPPSGLRGEGIRLVWIGSSSTLKGLESRRDLFEALGRAIPGLRLKVICDRFPHFEHLPVDAVPWSAETEAAELAAAEIGIGWVPDDPWSRGKCGLKLLQYRAAALPVVANPVGVQAEIVRPGIDGFLATTTEEWVAAIRTLAGDAALRRRYGAAGYQQVVGSFSTEVGGAAWVALLERLGKVVPC